MTNPRRSAEEQAESERRGYEQDLQAAQVRLKEWEDNDQADSPAAKDAKAQIENAKRELKRLGGREQAQERPARAKETREKRG